MSRPTALPIRLRLVGYADSTIATRLRPGGVLRRRQPGGKARRPLDTVGHRAVRGHGDAQFVAVVDHLLERECGPDDPPSNSGMATPRVTSSGDRPAARASHASVDPVATTAWSTGTPSGSSGESQPSPSPTARASPDRTAPPAAQVVVTTASASRNRSSTGGGAPSGPVRSE